MARRVALLLVSTSFLLSIALSWSAAATSSRSVTVHMDTEAWYQQVAPCLALVDCSAAPAPDPFPDDTLHVAITAGQETARTYLAFSLSAIPSGGRLLGGTLTLPIDSDPADGNLSPDAADIVACLVTTTFKPVRGSLDDPPPVDCKTSSNVVYDAKHASFGVDLAPFTAKWRVTGAALALLPSASAQQESGTWHVTFYATQKESKDAPPITAALTYAPKPEQGNTGNTPGPPPPSGGSGANSGPGLGPISSGGSFIGGIGSFGPPTSSTTTTTTTTQIPGTAALPAPHIVGFAGPGFAYPMVWALPLVLLAGLGAIGRVMTKDLYRRGI